MFFCIEMAIQGATVSSTSRILDLTVTIPSLKYTGGSLMSVFSLCLKVFKLLALRVSICSSFQSRLTDGRNEL